MARSAVRQYRVIAPLHPGYGNSPLIDGCGWVDDLAYLYLDLAAELGLKDAVLVGACSRRLDRGRDDGALDRAVLASRAGRPARHQVRRPRRARHRRHARACRAPNICRLRLGRSGERRGRLHHDAGDRAGAIVRGREAFALYGWKPYMHNPRLKRWLHRIDRPTLLLWGDAGRHRHAGLWRGLAAGDSRRQARDHPEAGHFPHWEQPEAFVDARRGLRRRQP